MKSFLFFRLGFFGSGFFEIVLGLVEEVMDLMGKRNLRRDSVWGFILERGRALSSPGAKDNRTVGVGRTRGDKGSWRENKGVVDNAIVQDERGDERKPRNGEGGR